jgi:AcrR family transcriptional regulator
MSRRTEAKEFNRARIRAAAEDIIRKEGMDKLTMRRLAERAGVSLRTPYNLIGSKTDVLISLIQEMEAKLVNVTAAPGERSVIEQLLDALDRIEAYFEADEEYFRGIYEGIMTSDHTDARKAAVAKGVKMCRLFSGRAVDSRELSPETDADLLGRHLAIQIFAVLGMWGSGFFSNHESIAQVRRAWCAVLLNHCSDESRRLLEASYHAACETKG